MSGCTSIGDDATRGHKGKGTQRTSRRFPTPTCLQKGAASRPLAPGGVSGDPGTETGHEGRATKSAWKTEFCKRSLRQGTREGRAGPGPRHRRGRAHTVQVTSHRGGPEWTLG